MLRSGRLLIALTIVATLALAGCRAGAGLDESQIEGTAQPSGGHIESTPTPHPGELAQRLLDEGKRLLEQDECEAALDTLQRAAELGPDMPETLLALGNALVRNAQVPDAIEAYQTAIGLDSEYAAAYSNLGAAYLRTIDDPASTQPGSLPESLKLGIEAFQRALEIEPSDAETHANLGSAYLLASQIPQAKEELEESIRLDADLAEAYVGLGYAYLLMMMPAEAGAQLSVAVELEPSMPEAWYALAVSHLEQNQTDQAINALETLLAIEIPPACKGDVQQAAAAREQAETVLLQLRGP